MREILHNTMKLEIDVRTGVRYICDVCGRIIADSTLKTTGKDSDDYKPVKFIGIHSSIDGEGYGDEFCACTPGCANKIREKWINSITEHESPEGYFKEEISTINEIAVDERFYKNCHRRHRNLSEKEWNELKVDSEPDPKDQLLQVGYIRSEEE